MKLIIKAFLALGFVAAASILYFFYSIHSSYYQSVRAVESYKHAKAVTTSLSEYHSIHLKYPDSLDELNTEKAENHHIGKIIFDNQAGVIKAQLAGKSLSEGILIFSPQIKNNSEVSYICHPQNVPPKYVPKECAVTESDSN